ncbi:MAG: hypothetical protein E7348_00785 [Clostridiales bacterium]|nr:hypothetical protein [Clostridiales bacterium]
MNTLMIILICIDVIFLAGIIAFVIVMTLNSKKVLPAQTIIDEDDNVYETVIEEVIVTEAVEQVPTRKSPIKVVVKAVPKEEPVVVEEKQVAPVVEAVEAAEDNDANEDAKRIPFAQKLLTLDSAVQTYYAGIDNAFRAMRKINPRVSTRSVSYRLGRELVAKLTIRGKTMRLHLALDVNAFPQNIYFQKDLSDTKSYIEVPFTVKVKSERGYKNALKLIDALAEAKGIEKKTRYTEIDSLQTIKELADNE